MMRNLTAVLLVLFLLGAQADITQPSGSGSGDATLAGTQTFTGDKTFTGILNASAATVTLGSTFTLDGGATPTVDAFGELSSDNNAWAASFGALTFFNGTAATFLVGVTASDTPTNGQVPTWNTGGGITWETPSGGSSLTSTRVGYGDGSNLLTGEAAFVYTAASNILTVGGVTMGAGSEVSTIGPLVDAVDGTTPLHNIVQTVAAGTAYTLTTTYANVDFGTTDPVIVIPNAGTYMVYALFDTTLVSATATTQVVQGKIRRTNNTAADLGFASAELLPPGVAASVPGVSVFMVGGKYTTTNTDDSVTIQAQISASLGAGTVTVTNARIWAERAY